MTRRELIAALAEVPDDAPVCVYEEIPGYGGLAMNEIKFVEYSDGEEYSERTDLPVGTVLIVPGEEVPSYSEREEQE